MFYVRCPNTASHSDKMIKSFEPSTSHSDTMLKSFGPSASHSDTMKKSFGPSASHSDTMIKSFGPSAIHSGHRRVIQTRKKVLRAIGESFRHDDKVLRA
ncbi:hypothetical protein GQ457_07G004840 [Hibiscus cannabinus]